MLMRKGLFSSTGRRTAMATITVLAVTMSEPPPAIAGPASKGVAATKALSDATDFSAIQRRRHYRRGGRVPQDWPSSEWRLERSARSPPSNSAMTTTTVTAMGPAITVAAPTITAAGHIMAAAIISLTSVPGRVL